MKAAALAAGLALAALQAEASCRQALLLALDVSGSVDELEYTMQLGGVAKALTDPGVVDALLALPENPVALAIFEWSSSSFQREIADWTLIETPEDIASLAAHLMAWRRATAPEATGIGAAMRHAADVFHSAPFCWKQTLDISGDGKNNDWPLPRDVRDSGSLGTATVNALVIGQEMLNDGDHRMVGVGELTAYFRANVISGPGAFVEVALGFEDYANAMTRKLLREISAPPLGSLEPGGALDYAMAGSTDGTTVADRSKIRTKGERDAR